LSESENLDFNEMRKLYELLVRIENRLKLMETIKFTSIYIGWCIWLTTILLYGFIIEILSLPYWLFFIYFIPSFVATLVLTNLKLPRLFKVLDTILEASGVQIDSGERRRIWKRAFYTWNTSFTLVFILGYMYGSLGASTGLLIALGIGNLAYNRLYWRYYRLIGGVVLSILLFVFAGLNILLSIIKPGYEWLFTTLSILFTYLLFAMYLLILPFRQ